ncbi:MAG TPA: hypothetical protein VNY78_06445 [Edaphobacter sp.]|nr:hypothetical protein [Edaphobacter sp.]
MPIQDLIQSLDDKTAKQILGRIAGSQPAPGGERIAWSPEIGKALAEEFGVAAPAGGTISEGELARQALLVLAEDPEAEIAIERLASTPMEGGQTFDFGIGIAVAVLIVLQSHVKFERNPDGKWSLKVEKKPTSDSLVKGLVQKLIGFAK